MPSGSSGKQERQYEHIKDSGRRRGMSEGRAKEMAARTVNKDRSRSGQTKSSGGGSGGGRSSSKRGGGKSGG